MENKKVLLGILCNETEDGHLFWLKACQEIKHKIEYRLIPFTGPNWLEEVKAYPFDYFFAHSRHTITDSLSESGIWPSLDCYIKCFLGK